MHPILLKIGPISLPSYGACFATGVLLAILFCIKQGKKEGIDIKRFTDLIFYTLIISLLGAKVFLFITEFNNYINNPGQIKYLLTSGGTFYGGLIFGIFFAVWFTKKHKLKAKRILDIAAPAIALAHAFGRLGCFLAGCCYGRETQTCPIGVTFPNHEHTVAPHGKLLYPTQAIESVLNFLNFLLLFIFYKKRKFQGQIFVMYIINYSIIRFCVEFFRGDTDRGYIFGNTDKPFSSLSIPQLISILGLIAGIILFRKFKKSAQKELKETNREK